MMQRNSLFATYDLTYFLPFQLNSGRRWEQENLNLAFVLILNIWFQSTSQDHKSSKYPRVYPCGLLTKTAATARFDSQVQKCAISKVRCEQKSFDKYQKNCVLTSSFTYPVSNPASSISIMEFVVGLNLPGILQGLITGPNNRSCEMKSEHVTKWRASWTSLECARIYSECSP